MDLVCLATGLFRNGPVRQPSTSDDLRLVEAIRSGERAGEAEFAERFHDRVFTVALRRLKDSETARDVAQDVILAVLLSLREGRLNHAERLSAFVFGTARNLINNHFRLADRRNERSLTEDLPARPAPDSTELEEHMMLREALFALPPSDRQILRLILVDGCKPAEIAKNLQLHPDVVRARKSRALKKIRQAITSRVTKRQAAATQTIRGGT